MCSTLIFHIWAYFSLVKLQLDGVSNLTSSSTSTDSLLDREFIPSGTPPEDYSQLLDSNYHWEPECILSLKLWEIWLRFIRGEAASHQREWGGDAVALTDDEGAVWTQLAPQGGGGPRSSTHVSSRSFCLSDNKMSVTLKCLWSWSPGWHS